MDQEKLEILKIGGGGSGVSNGSTPNQNDSAIGISSLSELSSGSGGSNVTEYQKKIESTQNSYIENESKYKHIFRDEDGHIPDTPENRKLILELANTPNHYIGKDARGIDWYAHILPDGSQLWVRIWNGKIDNAGRNSVPAEWDDETGLYRNIHKTDESRNQKKKLKKEKRQMREQREKGEHT